MSSEELYKEYGADNREEYVEQLAEENGVDSEVAIAISEMLGESEDFDGLVSTLEDIGMGYF